MSGTFAAVLRRLRVAADLTQAELASRAGLGERTISNLERGINTSPYPSTIRLLSDALGASDRERAELVGAARGGSDGGSRPWPVGGYLGAAPSAELVARESERSILDRTVSAVAAGEGRLLLLAGEPGIGKTRLAQEVSILAAERGFTVATGRCYEPQAQTPYAPFLEAFEVILPDLFGANTPPGDGDDAQRLHRAAATFLREQGRVRPVALLLDDLHWADGASLDLLAYLVRHTRSDPVLLLGTYRNVEVGRTHPLRELTRTLAREDLVETLSVDRLDQDATTRLITERLDSPVSEEFGQLIHRHTDGNPFFTVEMLKALVDRGDLSRIDGRWVRRELTDLEAPASVSDAISERVARLAPGTQQLLEVMSVLGEVVDLDDLGVADLPEDQLEAALDEATAAGLLSQVGDGYAFDHNLTQQALYGWLPPVRRRRLHRRAGDHLEQRPDAVRRRRTADLARHLEAGGAPDRALPYVLMAGDAAAAIHAAAEARGHYDHALALAEEVGDQPSAAAGLERLGLVELTSSRYDEALDRLLAASNTYRALGDNGARLRAEGMIAQAYHRRGDGQTAAERLTEVVADLDRPTLAPDEQPGVAILSRGLALSRLTLRQHDLALEAAERATRLAYGVGADALTAQAESAHGTVLLFMDAPHEALRVLESALAHARTAGSITGESDVLLALPWGLLMQGRIDEAFALGERGVEISRLSGDSDAESLHAAGLGLNRFYAGDWATAEHWLERSVELAWSHSTLFSGIPPAYLGLLRRGQGDLEAAETLYRDAARAPDLNTFAFDAYVDARMAELDLLRGDPTSALTRLEPWVAQEPPTRIHDPMLLTMAAQARLDLDDAGGAAGLAERAVARAEATNNQVDGIDAARVRSLSQAALGRRDEARAGLEDARSRAAALPHPYAEARAARDLADL